MWDKKYYLFPYFNGCTVEVWEWISNFISHCTDYLLQVEEASHTDFLFLHGTSDQCIDPRLMLRIASRLLDHGHEGVSVHMYQGAGHVIDPPYLPFFYTMWHKVYGRKTLKCWYRSYACHLYMIFKFMIFSKCNCQDDTDQTHIVDVL